MKRQQIRKLLLLIALLLFPITMWYFSPIVIIMGMMEHILNGSFFVFLGMMVAAMFLGRSFCGFLCPMGCLQECAGVINGKAAKQGKRSWIKLIIWVIWLGAVAVSFLCGKGEVKADFFYMTQNGVSIAEVQNYIIYYSVILLVLVPALLHGRRAFCHYICWMAPFMMLGEKIGQVLHLPQLHVAATKDACVSCKKCNGACPMGLDVEKMVQEKKSCKSADCIRCGACVDNCPKKALSYSWKDKSKSI